MIGHSFKLIKAPLHVGSKHVSVTWLQSHRARSHERTKSVLKSESEGRQCHMVPTLNTGINTDASPKYTYIAGRAGGWRSRIIGRRQHPLPGSFPHFEKHAGILTKRQLRNLYCCFGSTQYVTKTTAKKKHNANPWHRTHHI